MAASYSSSPKRSIQNLLAYIHNLTTKFEYKFEKMDVTSYNYYRGWDYMIDDSIEILN